MSKPTFDEWIIALARDLYRDAKNRHSVLSGKKAIAEAEEFTQELLDSGYCPYQEGTAKNKKEAA